jgi:uncharacterized protein
MATSQTIIEQTRKWIVDVVVAHNFCPFAAQVIKEKKVHYQVDRNTDPNACLDTLVQELIRLDENDAIATSFVIFPEAFSQFDDFLDLVARAEKRLKQKNYEGIYQLASFHPLYRFADSTDDDAANYTNRSVYPMLHVLREASLDKALEHYNNPEGITDSNIALARSKGLSAMITLRESCFQV